MKKNIWTIMIILALTLLAACGGNDNENTANEGSEEPAVLEVEFELPETANVGETIEPKATVTYGEEMVKDAEFVRFEYWEQGHEDDSTTVDATNNEDGTYTAEISIDQDGVYEMYAHTQAREMHTMPKKAVTVGEGSSDETAGENEEDGGHEHGHHADGFSMDFSQPKNVQTGQETDLTVQLQMDEEPLENANVQYEITSDDNSDFHEWVDADENEAGEYSAAYAFDEAGAYTMTIHVKNDDGLHEHEEHEVEVK
ncbi:FixH family protein [Lentibacillus salicampi]|uniref:YtkA-like domain-containing protein n=1 Tax=Lentibacillus salicampi TaxID=175306 RepID=A0A4Y9A7Q1_9BACI|nr:FixH family protein [Lentibacillus salicampi]TFJ91796.1 hypothetical protein E4U82_15930 [Lentibacillus salicampi]